jgi:iron complex outermembrane receptor protein
MRPLLLLALTPVAAFAQTTPVELDRIQITATRLPESARDVPASVSIVERTDGRIDTIGIALSERLTTVPGVFARDRHNYAQDEQISIRGFGTRASFGIRGVRLYLDGVTATMPDGQGQVSHVALAFAKRIEVLRGPFSVLYGNAAGGVIQVFTDDVDAPGRFDATAAIGPDDTRRVSFAVHGMSERIGGWIGAQHLATAGARAHSSAERNTVHGKALVEIGASTTLSFMLDTLNAPQAQDPLGLDRAQFERDATQASPNALLFDTRKSVQQGQLGTLLEHAADAGVFRATAYVGQRDVVQFLAVPVGTQRNPLSSGGVVDLHSPYSGIDVRWIANATFAHRPLQWVAGLSFDSQEQHRRGYENFIGTTLGVRGAIRADQRDRVEALDPYAQVSWQASDAWSITAGARHSRVRFRSDDAYTTATNPDDSGQVEHSATSPVLGVSWHASDALQVYASYGEGFETPTFNELQYRSDGGSGLNFDLQPASTRSGEVGFKISRGALRTEVALFRARTDDELTVNTSAGGRTTFQNAGRAERNGVELSGAMPLARRWHAEFALTWLDARFVDGFLACAATPCTVPTVAVSANAPIPGIPRTTAQAALRWGDPLDGWHVRFDGGYVGDLPVNNVGDERAASYAVFGASTGYGVRHADGEGRVFLAVDNLGDRTYAGSVIVNEANRRYYEPAPGRSITVGVEWHWR